MNSNSWKAWTMWSVALLFFAYQFIMRLFPGLIMHDVMIKHHVTALDFGFLSSMYYFGYAGMQIPIAIFLDRFGPRMVITLCALLCSLATFVFISAESWLALLIARLLIGVGSAGGFLGTSKVISMVFPEHRYAKMIGLTFTFGIIGAVYGGKPVSLLIHQYTWQTVGEIIAAVGLVSALLVWICVRPRESKKQQETHSVFFSLKNVLKNPYVLILALANMFMVGSLEGFADVWGVSFLMQAFALERSNAAFLTSFIFIGMIFGGPILVSIATRFSTFYTTTAACGFLTALLFVFLLTRPELFPYFTVCLIMFVIGIFCCYQVLMFAMGSKLVSEEDKGVTVAFLNSINMFGGSFFHLVIGSLLDLSWKGGLTDQHVKIYTLSDYNFAISAIPFFAILGALMVLGIGYKIRNKA